MESIHPAIIRELWSVVTATQTNLLLQLNDGELANQLLNQLHLQHPLQREEVPILTEYVRLRTPLIRDLAEARLFAY